MPHITIPAQMVSWLWWLFAAVFADVLFGILTSIGKTKFSLSFVDNYLKTHILNRVVPVLILMILAISNPVFASAFYVACGTVYASMLGEILGKFGLPIGQKLQSEIAKITGSDTEGAK
jgi:Na+-translocating ferredoxin:NAD+ oxidoreductase RnfD subunit